MQFASAGVVGAATRGKNHIHELPWVISYPTTVLCSLSARKQVYAAVSGWTDSQWRIVDGGGRDGSFRPVSLNRKGEALLGWKMREVKSVGSCFFDAAWL